MNKHVTVSNDVMSSLSDICLNDLCHWIIYFFMSLKNIHTCVHEMLCYFTETKADTNYTCILLFFRLVLDVKAFSTFLTIEVLTHMKTSGRFLSVNSKT